MSWDCPNCGGMLDPFDQCFACDTYGTPRERREDGQAELDRRMNAQTLPCCGPDGCTGGPSCWHDEPDNIPEDWS